MVRPRLPPGRGLSRLGGLPNLRGPRHFTKSTIRVSKENTGDVGEIQKAINMLPEKGGYIFIEPGTYNITTPIVINKPGVTLEGAGKTTKITSTANISLVSATSQDDLVIKNIWFVGNAGNVSTGIDFDTVTESIINDCWIDSCGLAGILLDENCSEIEISGCKTGLGGGCLIGILTKSSNHVISGNWCNNQTGPGIYLTGTSQNNNIYGNVTSGNDIGIFIEGSSDNNVINNNRMHNNTQQGIGIEAGTGNILEGNRGVGNGQGILDEGTDTQIGHNSIS